MPQSHRKPRGIFLLAVLDIHPRDLRPHPTAQPAFVTTLFSASPSSILKTICSLSPSPVTTTPTHKLLKVSCKPAWSAWAANLDSLGLDWHLDLPPTLLRFEPVLGPDKINSIQLRRRRLADLPCLFVQVVYLITPGPPSVMELTK